MKENQNKNQLHEYSLEEYGLTVEHINTVFEDYIRDYRLKDWYSYYIYRFNINIESSNQLLIRAI